MDERLIDACKAGDLDGVTAALRAGADLHCFGDAPMFHAATRGHMAIVQRLWLYSDPPRVFHVGQGTLRKAAERGYTAVAVFLAPYATPSELVAAVGAARRRGQDTTATALEAASPARGTATAIEWP